MVCLYIITRIRVFLLILMGSLPLSHSFPQLTVNVTYPDTIIPSSASFPFQYTESLSLLSNSHTQYIRSDFTYLLVECSSTTNLSNASLVCGASNTYCSVRHQINSTRTFISNYTCIVTEVSNTSTTQNISIEIILGYPPTIIRNATDIYLAENVSSVQTVEFSALPLPVLSWSVNSILLLRNTTNLSNLTVPFNDIFGTYTVVASNMFGNVSLSFEVRLGQSPKIRTPSPTTSALCFLADRSYNLTVVLTAAPPPANVTWELSTSSATLNLTNSSLFRTSSISSVENITYTLTIISFAANLTGNYLFIAENAFGNVSANFSVSLGKVPNITSVNPKESPHYVLMGSAVNLTFVVTAIPRPTIRWTFQSIHLYGLYNVTTFSGDQLTYTLSIPMLHCFVNYTVSVQNKFGSDNATFSLLRGQLPTRANTALTYVTNSTVEFNCSTDATPPVTDLNCSSWFYNNTELCGRGYMFDGTVLTIPRADVSHAGTYTCMPTNVLGPASNTFTLQIHTLPSFPQTGRDLNLTLNASQPLNLSCTALGFPTPRIQWTLNGDIFSSPYIYTDGLGSVLSFDSLQGVDNGTYRCIAEANTTISPGDTVLSNASSNGTILTIIPPPPTTPPLVLTPSPLYDSLIFTGVFCGIILLILIFIVACAVVCLLRNRIRSVRIMELNTEDKAVAHILEMSMVQPSEKSFVMVPREHNMIDSLSETDVIEDVKVRDIANYIEELKANDQLGFSEQYELIRKKSPEHPSEVGDLRENKSKNRYNNIFCFDQSRVKLTPIDEAHSDFIHANFITGYHGEREYIATQGPLENTVEDFWRMVWEYRCRTIVMLTKCMENLKKKCAFYWVEEGEDTFFEMTVTYLSSLHLVDYSIVKLSVRPVDFTGDELLVSLFQFVSWPDFGTPDSPAGLLHFRNKIRDSHPPNSPSPMVVHCSAGVGRSGTFIALDMELQKAAVEDRINPFNRVVDLREERNFLVQTEGQYVFLHFAILEGILFGYEDTPVADLPVLIDNLYRVDEEANKTGFELDFQALTVTNIDSRQFSDGNLPCNIPKNRRTVVPYNKNRIKLTMLPGIEGSDYINASLIDSYAYKRVFIATQAPLKSTICDFWRMIVERNVSMVIMFCNLVERNAEVCAKYWPELGESLELDGVRVTNEGEEASEELKMVERDLRVVHEKLKYCHTIKHYHYTGWVDNRFPEDFNGLIEMLEITNEATTENRKSPIVVQCTSGIGRTGVFLALYNSIEQVTFEESVNLFYVIKKLRLQRTQTIQSIHQYEFCYLALIECLRALEEKDQQTERTTS